jgi:hypothetical protein
MNRSLHSHCIYREGTTNVSISGGSMVQIGGMKQPGLPHTPLPGWHSLSLVRLCPSLSRECLQSADLTRTGNDVAWRMASSGILRRVALVRTDVSEQLSVSIIRAKNLWTRNIATDARYEYFFVACVGCYVPSSPILVALMMEALSSSETSVLTRATRRNIPEYDILHSYRHENLKSYIALTGWTL